jgi:hypothetical protein
MNVPFTAMHFSVYEAAKKWLLHVDDGDEEAEDRLSVQLVAGGLAVFDWLFLRLESFAWSEWCARVLLLYVADGAETAMICDCAAGGSCVAWSCAATCVAGADSV